MLPVAPHSNAFVVQTALDSRIVVEPLVSPSGTSGAIANARCIGSKIVPQVDIGSREKAH